MLASKSWIAGLCACLVSSAPALAAGPQTRTLATSPDGLRFELDVELPQPVRMELTADGRSFTRFEFTGCKFEGSPGAPELSVATELVALPPGGTATLRIVDAEVVDLGTLQVAPRPVAFSETIPAAGRTPAMEMPREEIRWDPRAYAADGARTEIATLGAAGTLRHQRIAAIEIRPLLFDPATSRTRLVKRVRLEIVLRPGAVTASEGDVNAPRVATSPSWERIYAGSLVNARAAEAWRRAPERAVQKGGALPSGLLRPGLLGEDEWKLRVRATGPTRVTAAALASAGFPPGTPANRLRFYLRRFAAARPLDPDILEIPILVVDVDSDGTFDPEDSFVFYAEHPRDDATSEDRFARYSAENVYWLSVVASGTPARMAVRPPQTSPAPGPSVFQQQLFYEEDRTINPWVFGSIPSELVDSSALYFWTGRFPVATAVTVAVPGRAPGAGLGICAVTQEDMAPRPYRLFALTGSRDSVLIGTNFGTNPPDSQAPAVQTTCGVAADSLIDPGDVRIILRPFNTGGLVPFMDRIRLDYQATYTAVANRIRCTSGGAVGPVAYTIGGFTDPNLRAFDITNPKAPVTFAGSYSGGTLTFTDNPTAGSDRIYLVVPDATIPSIAAERDASADDVQILSDLGSLPMGSYDVLVVVYDDFADEPTLAQWNAWRTAQGHRIRTVRTSDVFDAFRGGLSHYGAIHRLSQLAFTNWGIQFIVLVGDGSEDTIRLFGDSGPNYVPSRLCYDKVPSSSGGPAEYRNDMNDKYYAQVAGSALDIYPDLLLGRLPVGSREELASVLQKTMLYETPAPNDDGAWRKRVLMLSDDEWVKRTGIPGFPGPAHIRGISEPGFQRSIEFCSDIVDGAFPGDLHAVRFLLRDHSNRLYPTVPEHRPVSIDSSAPSAPHATSGFEQSFYFGVGDGQVGKALIDSVGDGVLFLALQSHANRVIVADEQIMSTIERPFAPAFHNDGKPFIFFGYGCHLNEFGVAREQGDQITGGDALGEYLVLTPSRGAVASYASTGFEFLGQNNLLHQNTWDVIFNKRWNVGLGGRVVDSDTLASRWLLSDLLQIGELKIVDPNIIARYVLFGDPMLRLDAGVPRIAVNRIDNGFLQPNGRLVVTDPKLPLAMEITLRDEQGIDSLWAVQRFRGGATVPIDSVRITSDIDTAGAVTAKRSYTVAFELMVDRCDFDVVVGARDLSGRVSELVGRLLFDQRLLANGIEIHDGDRVDPRTAFRFEILGCTPIPPPLPLQVFVDGAMLPPSEVQLNADSASVNWTADFSRDLANGNHVLSFQYEGSPLVSYSIVVGGFGMSEVLIFPNPMRKQHDVMRMYFHLGEPIAGGSIRVLTMSGRTVLREDLGTPGVVKSDVAVPPGSIGSGTGQDASHWNYVELFREGRDLEGDAVANGVYLVELSIRGLSGQQQRKRDKLVIMR